MKQFTVLFLLITTSLSAQNDFAPLGATWKYTFHRFVTDFDYDCEYNVCDQYKQRLEVIDTTTIQEKKVSVLRQFEGDDTFSDIPEIYIHARNDSVFFYHENEFYLLYDFSAEDGDTININVPTYHNGPGAYAATPFNGQGPIVNLDVIVEDKGTTIVSGEMRRVTEYKSLNFYEDEFRIPNVIDNIGSGDAFFGMTGFFVADGCFGFFICYEDENQAYTPFGCCEFPEDFPERRYAPLGAEWLYEGWSEGPPSTSGCDHGCQGNYNLFRVEDEIDYSGRIHAVVRRYHRTKNTEWQETNDVIHLYDYDNGFYASRFNINSFWSTYRTDVSIGDTIYSSAARNYPKFIGDDNYEYSFPRIGGEQVVEAIDTILISGQSRLKIKFRSLDDFRIGEVIEGIGPLYEGLLGYDQGIPASGCPPRLICYRDDDITYTTTDCGCEFPMGPTSTKDKNEVSFNVYPNPTSDKITIAGNFKSREYEIKIIDHLGKVVKYLKAKPSDGELLLPLVELHPGLYKIHLNDKESFSIIDKVIKI